LSATYYRNRTGNQLVQEPLAAITGFSSVEFNLPAVVQNSGVEFTLTTINIKSKNFSWTTSANITLPSNKLVAFPNINQYPQYEYNLIVGKSLFIENVYHYTGVNPQTGLYSFGTKNTNGIPSYPQDLVTTPPITQKYYGGVNNSFSYKGVQLDVFIQYVDQLADNYKDYFAPPGTFNSNQPTVVFGRWTAPGDLTAIQRFGTDQAGTVDNPYYTLGGSDGVISKASFIRLKNLALSYTIPARLNGRMHLQRLKVYVQCQNLLTITRYLGMDPEVGGLGLPPLRMVTAGVQISL